MVQWGEGGHVGVDGGVEDDPIIAQRTGVGKRSFGAVFSVPAALGEFVLWERFS